MFLFFQYNLSDIHWCPCSHTPQTPITSWQPSFYLGCLQWKPQRCSSLRNHIAARSRRKPNPATGLGLALTRCNFLLCPEVRVKPGRLSLTSTDEEGSGSPRSRPRSGAVASRQICDHFLLLMSKRFIPDPTELQRECHFVAPPLKLPEHWMKIRCCCSILCNRWRRGFEKICLYVI